VEGLKLVQQQANQIKYSFLANFNSQVIATLIAPIELNSNPAAGWVVVLQHAL
jgi:hypothetical protein